jgi:hypothetical protein
VVSLDELGEILGSPHSILITDGPGLNNLACGEIGGRARRIARDLDADAIEQSVADARVADRLVGIVLLPRLEVALRRNRERQTRSFDTSILEGVMHELDGTSRTSRTDRLGTLLDNSEEPGNATVERFLSFAR